MSSNRFSTRLAAILSDANNASLQDARTRALKVAFTTFAFVPILYVPYILFMPLYEGKRLPFLILSLGLSGLMLFNAELCRRQRPDTAIISFAIICAAGITTLFIKLEILMTMKWLLILPALIACLAARPLYPALIAAICSGVLILAHCALHGQISASLLKEELGLLGFATCTIALIAYSLSTSHQHTLRELVSNREETIAATRHSVSLLDSAEAELELARHENNERGRFLARMSHELRTPLNAILGYAEILTEELEDEHHVPPHSIDDARCIQSASRHLLELIQDISNVSDIDAGLTHIQPSRFHVGELIREVIATMKHTAQINGDTLHTQIELEDPFVCLDPTWSRQILFNLLSNAIKFTHHGDITTSATADDSSITLRVQDSGIGMTSAQLEGIFERFEQADQDTHREFGGSGLGLALCYKLCSELGGQISIESTRSVGTTVTVELPRTAQVR